MQIFINRLYFCDSLVQVKRYPTCYQSLSADRKSLDLTYFAVFGVVISFLQSNPINYMYSDIILYAIMFLYAFLKRFTYQLQ